MTVRRSRAFVVAGALLLGAAGCASATGAAGVQPDVTGSVHRSASPSAALEPEPYEFALDKNWLRSGVTVSVKLAGGPATRMLVDTGSNGVVIARKAVGNDYRLPSPRQPFRGFTYSSSGNSYSGEWVFASLAISSATDSTGPAAITAPMLIRAVDQECDSLHRCSTDPAKLDVAMLGVGFDREQDGNAPVVDPHAGPDLNPFLQLDEMVAGTMPRSYSIGSGRLTLGASAAKGFSTIALQSTTTAAGTADWAAPQVCLTVQGSVAAQCGDLLLDTGLDYAIVQVPTGVDPPLRHAAGSAERPTVADGQHIALTSPALPDRLLYEFATGAPGAPRKVEWGHNTAAHGNKSFFNISRYALSQENYLYDATHGLVGFQPVR